MSAVTELKEVWNPTAEGYSSPLLQEASSLLDRVRELAPEIEARVKETEEGRAVPDDIVARLRDAGLFRMMYPKKIGGEELNQLQACRVIEELAKADGSVGWNGMVAFGFNIALSRYPASTLEKIFANGPDVLVRGAQAPLGRATAVPGGYRISGKWPFGSGSYKPEWVMASGMLSGADGKPQVGPSGIPEMRIGLFPAEEVEFLDTWYSVGLRGSSSHDFKIDDKVVAEEFTTDIFNPTITSSLDAPWLALPFFALAAPTHSAVVIGIAQGAIDEVTKASLTKRSAFNPAVILADDPIFQNKLGEVSARLYALRAGMDKVIENNWTYVQSRQPIPFSEVMRLTALGSYTHAQCLDIINDLFGLMGSTPVYENSALQRRWRDARVAAQHVSASQAAYGRYGSALVGKGPGLAPK
jgi:indole-3-acetate monooxygenase